MMPRSRTTRPGIGFIGNLYCLGMSHLSSSTSVPKVVGCGAVLVTRMVVLRSSRTRDDSISIPS